MTLERCQSDSRCVRGFVALTGFPRVAWRGNTRVLHGRSRTARLACLPAMYHATVMHSLTEHFICRRAGPTILYAGRLLMFHTILALQRSRSWRRGWSHAPSQPACRSAGLPPTAHTASVTSSVNSDAWGRDMCLASIQLMSFDPGGRSGRSQAPRRRLPERLGHRIGTCLRYNLVPSRNPVRNVGQCGRPSLGDRRQLRDCQERVWA
jgi:hypothetical protein